MESSQAYGFSHYHFVEYMSNLLCIPIELLTTHQDRLSTSDAVLGHIFPLSYGDDCPLTDLLQLSSLGQETLYLPY